MNISDITQFSTLSFFIFLIISFSFFWISRQEYRSKILLAISYLFYASYHPLHVFILAGTTLIDFHFAQLIHSRRQNKASTKALVLVCLLTNLVPLCYFKFSSLILNSIFFLNLPQFLLPLGLSFFTLQSIGYILDVNRGKTEPEKDLLRYALFVSFFPQIIAGPIEKSSEIIPQLKQRFDIRKIEWRVVVYLFSFGYFKKYIIADNIAFILKNIPIAPSEVLPIKYLSLCFFFIRIYCDFSGYTSMAKAIALCFQIRLTDNFNFPLFAKSPQDFWERWHMSLGRWIRNYFYLPLLIRTNNPYLTVMLVFPIMGLWHGANLNYLIWGIAWGLVIILSKMNERLLARLNKWISIIITFNIASLLMVFYKAENFESLRNYYSIFPLRLTFESEYFGLLIPLSALTIPIVVYELVLFIKQDELFIAKKSYAWLIIFYCILAWFTLSFSNSQTQQVFYLQF